MQLRYENPARGTNARLGTVKNVIGTLRGSAPPDQRKRLLLMAHYDTRSMTPGASDDGYGTAVLLEIARALAADAARKHDVTFLFTDAEETGLLGARAFVQQHPLAKEVALVVNVEARGNRGPSIMFQTSERAGALVRAYAEVAPSKVANSLTQSVYRKMPNDTDLTEWLPTGVGALNFANIDGFERYHSSTDDATDAEPRTIQHHGAQALAVARHFASAPLPPDDEADAQYFAVGPLFVRYPESVARVLAVVAPFLAVIATILGLRRKRIAARALGLGLFGAIAVPLGAFAAAYAAWSVALKMHPEYWALNVARPTVKALHLAYVLALVAGVALFVYERLARKASLHALAAGSALVWGVLSVLVAQTLSGGAYLVTWPLVASTLALGALAFRAKDDDWVALALQLAAAAVAVLVVAPVAHQFFVAFGPHGLPMVGVLAAIVLSLAAPLVATIARAAPRGAPLLALAVAVATWAGTQAMDTFDARHPRPDTLFFAVDADTREAFWVSSDAEPDAWTTRVLSGATPRALPAFFPRGTGKLLVRSASPAPFEAPSAKVIGDDASSDRRTLHVRAHAPPRAEMLAFSIASGLRAARVQGIDVPLTASGGLAVYYTAPPVSGVDISVDREAPGPIDLHLVSQRSGLPEDAALGPRPDGLMPRTGTLPPWDELTESDMFVVSKAFRF
jgi:hypothetical protein